MLQSAVEVALLRMGDIGIAALLETLNDVNDGQLRQTVISVVKQMKRQALIPLMNVIMQGTDLQQK